MEQPATESLPLLAKTKPTLIFLVKISLSVLALFLVFRKVDFTAFREVLAGTNWWVFPIIVLAIALSKVCSAFRLNHLFRAIGLSLSEKSNLQLYWLGMYYNLFLPGGIGGDAYKVVLLKRQEKANIRDLVWATLTDRAVGLAILVLFGLLLVPFLTIRGVTYSWSFVGVPILAGILWVGLRLIKRSFVPLYTPLIGWSLMVQSIQVIGVLGILWMLDVPGDWTGYCFLFLVSSILAALPISYGGAGAREIAFFYGAEWLTIPSATAVAVSLIFYAASLIVSLSGMRYSFKQWNLSD